jgi:hypothetical protein
MGVKFCEYVTGGVVKVPEKIEFNWSIFGWFGHFTEHVVCGVLGFRWKYYVGWELVTCKDTQEAHRNTLHDLDSLEFTEFWIWAQKGGIGELTAQRDGEREGAQWRDVLTREEEAEKPMQERDTGARRRRSPPVSRGRGWSLGELRRGREQRMKGL